ncbi:MAG: (Fe-S)-binding protein [Methanobrevibacter sp.]|jgi:Fe-S oxidoreductase|nr:(Fe-S)-binding protein [Methanobrevibacter sp.]
MLYFRGCTARERMNSISDAVEAILKIANIDYEILDNEECCGSVLLRTGFVDEAKEEIQKNTDKLNHQKVLTSCAGCYKTLSQDYKELANINLDVIHISQLLEQLIAENKITPKKSEKSKKVTYHDPCHLGRHSEEYDAPRHVISYFADIEEMENIKENAKCCGSGGGVKSAYPEIAKSIAKFRGEEANKTNADMIVTSCPFCKLNLSENSSLDVLDLSEFVMENIEK